MLGKEGYLRRRSALLAQDHPAVTCPAFGRQQLPRVLGLPFAALLTMPVADGAFVCSWAALFEGLLGVPFTFMSRRRDI